MSTDEKPTDCDVNSLFYELDTGDFYYFDGVWKKVGSKVQLQDTGNSGTIEITENDVYNVTDYDYADVNVPGVIPVGTLPILENGTADVTSYATAEVDVDYVNINFNLPAFKKTTPTELSQARNYLAAATIAPAGSSSPQSGYALFGGGYGGSTRYATVDAYDQNLTRSTPTALSQARYTLAATNIGNYALFGGGYYYDGGYTYPAIVDAYDTNLTRTTPTELSQARSSLTATTIGDYALFGGGYGGSARSNVVDAYDTNLTRTTPTELSQARNYLAAATIAPAGGSSPQSGYALFGGGYANGYSAVVDAYDQSLTRSTPTAFSQGRSSLAATNIGNYALFGGGYYYAGGYTYPTIVDAYDTNLTRTTPTALSQGRSSLTATTIGDYALFGGGYGGSARSAVVDAYGTNLTRTTPTELSQARDYLAATSIGDYALFGGGYSDASQAVTTAVDAYNPFHDIQVLPETKYNFNNSGEIFSDTMQTINIQGPVVGYLKIKNVNVN